ncbi:MAG: hypothetical protein N4A43_05155 [Alphaproteobacteria bacterium]|jgi:hypothetical protein|nr:hypothetical protein [Alphaproteobacteria bacterium]
MKNLIKNKKINLALAASLLTGCSSVYKYSNDDILIVSTNKALNIMEDVNGFMGTTSVN